MESVNNCLGCDLCCRYYKIYIFPSEAKKIASKLKISYKDFVTKYTDLHFELYDLPKGAASKGFYPLPKDLEVGSNVVFLPILSLKRKEYNVVLDKSIAKDNLVPNHSCIFLNDKLCSIYDSRPTICRLFPRFKFSDEIYKFCKLDDGSRMQESERDSYYNIIDKYVKDLEREGFKTTWRYLPPIASHNINIIMGNKNLNSNSKLLLYLLDWIKSN